MKLGALGGGSGTGTGSSLKLGGTPGGNLNFTAALGGGGLKLQTSPGGGLNLGAALGGGGLNLGGLRNDIMEQIKAKMSAKIIDIYNETTYYNNDKCDEKIRKYFKEGEYQITNEDL